MSDGNYPTRLRDALSGKSKSEGSAIDAAGFLSRDSKIIEALSKHYTDLFIYQARQRLDSIRFFFVGYAFLAAAVTNLATANKIEAAAALSFLGGIISILFLRLDYRNGQLVEITEKPLKGLQEFFSDLAGADDSWRMFARCDVQRRFFTNYGLLVSILYCVFWLTSFATATLLMHSLLKSSSWSDDASTATFMIAFLLLLLGLVCSLGRPDVDDKYSLPRLSASPSLPDESPAPTGDQPGTI